jgi:hypothetical protein
VGGSPQGSRSKTGIGRLVFYIKRGKSRKEKRCRLKGRSRFESGLFIVKAILTSYSKIPTGLLLVGEKEPVSCQHGYTFEGQLPCGTWSRNDLQLTLGLDSPLFPGVDIETAEFEIEVNIKCTPKPVTIEKKF